jgi:hypothetical protein
VNVGVDEAGRTVAPRRFIDFAPLGMRSEAEGPTADIFPPSMRIPASRIALAPVPSMRLQWIKAIAPDPSPARAFAVSA